MRKMYFAMIPKRGFLESAAITAGIGLGALYGAKWLLGEEKYNEYKTTLKNKVFGGSDTADFSASAQDGGTVLDDNAKAKEEQAILDRIRAAAKL